MAQEAHAPCCPSDDAPPATKNGWPAYFPRPPASHGGASAQPPCGARCALYSPSAAVAIVSGIVHASSKDRFGGI